MYCSAMLPVEIGMIPNTDPLAVASLNMKFVIVGMHLSYFKRFIIRSKKAPNVILEYLKSLLILTLDQ